MRRKLFVAALGLGVAGALLPATSASAVCFHLPTGQCISPCPSGAWQKVANAYNETVGEDTGTGIGPMNCLA